MKLTKRQRGMVKKAANLIANKKEFACCFAFHGAYKKGYKTYNEASKLCTKFYKFYNQDPGRGYWIRGIDEDNTDNIRVLWLLLFAEAG